jgi:hypothetical protein
VIRVSNETTTADPDEEAEVDLLDTIRRSLRRATKERVP